MNRWTLSLVWLALGCGLWVLSARIGLGQVGGLNDPTYPFGQPAAKPANPFLPSNGGSAKPSISSAAALNADIAVKPENGEWMICLTVYKGPQAHQWARQLVSVLRGPKYKLWAYVYDYTPESREKQEAFRKERIEQLRPYIEWWQKLPEEEKKKQPPPKVHLPQVNVEDEVAVLVGGYKDQDTARRALGEIKLLKRPSPDEVQMDKYSFAESPDNRQWGSQQKQEEVYVNPLARGFVSRNPSLPKHADAKADWDLKMLRSLNSDEPYSLLNCPKKFTLVIKEYHLPVYVQQTGDSSLFRKMSDSVLNTTQDEDKAFLKAHYLASFLRDTKKLEAYALHDRTVSYVCIGGFDSPDDPKLKETQQRIANLSHDCAQLIQHEPHLSDLMVYPVGIPMKVPH